MTQTAFRKHNSGEDAIFANLEAMSHYLTSLTIEDQVMLCAFDAGINEKGYRLLKSRYMKPTANICSNGQLYQNL